MHDKCADDPSKPRLLATTLGPLSPRRSTAQSSPDPPNGKVQDDEFATGVGRRLGTTATCVATCTGPGADTQIVTHAGSKGSRLPSGVMWWEGRLLVGSAAYNRANLDPTAYDETPKRSIAEGDRSLLLGERDVPVLDALTEILHEATRPGLAQLNDPTPAWVLTHPAVWGPPQLELLSAAAGACNAGPTTLLPEPVAAAWAVHNGKLTTGDTVAVFDWGGGTLDAAVLRWDGGRFDLVGPPAGEDPLGGEDVDFTLEQFVLQRLPDEVREQVLNPANSRDRRLGRELRRLTRMAKEELSDSSHTDLALSALEEPVRITLDEFNVIARPFIERCADVLHACLTASSITSNDLSAIYLVGDSSRIPLVHATISTLNHGVSVVPAELGKEAVARGAALAIAAGLSLTQPRLPNGTAETAGTPTNSPTPPNPEQRAGVGPPPPTISDAPFGPAPEVANHSPINEPDTVASRASSAGTAQPSPLGPNGGQDLDRRESANALGGQTPSQTIKLPGQSASIGATTPGANTSKATSSPAVTSKATAAGREGAAVLAAIVTFLVVLAIGVSILLSLKIYVVWVAVPAAAAAAGGVYHAISRW